jgi:hypothetical protein
MQAGGSGPSVRFSRAAQFYFVGPFITVGRAAAILRRTNIKNLITEAEKARLVCEMAGEALRVHQEGHNEP